MNLWTCVLSCFAMQDVPAGAEPILFDAIPDHIALMDLDEESGLDWVEVREGVLEWDAGGGSKLRIEFHGESVLWAVGDWDNDGRQDLVALVEGQTLECLLLSEGNLTWKTVLSGLGGKNKVPRGVRPAAILRDINGDSWDDLVVPVGEQVELWFGVSGQSPTPGPTLAVASTLSLAVEGMHGSNLLATVSRSLVVPEIRMRDISGDGRPDLLVTEQETVRQYIAGEEGITGVATAEVDFSKFRERLPEVKFDPGNIASLSKYAVLEEWSDLNNDGALDLLVLSGGTVFVYLGGKNGLDLRRPRDQMPTHGNVVYATAVSINEDEIPDLVLLRVEDISLARLFSFVFMDVEIDFDFLAYQGRGDGRFHKRPMKESKSVRLK
ncbi:MAG: VCBS repeat-containing protein, partial [Planctomycetes bacterium]|nr:VCBS repeat-containing protein [Planctomycetota bacterium]